MRQVAQAIWNRIADSEKLATPVMQALFKMSSEELDALLEKQAEKLEKNGVPDRVIVAYQAVMPLLLENKAIQNWLAKTEHLDLMGALPDVQTVAEAVDLMDREYLLTGKERAQLRELIESTLQT